MALSSLTDAARADFRDDDGDARICKNLSEVAHPEAPIGLVDELRHVCLREPLSGPPRYPNQGAAGSAKNLRCA
jgi:hypothetical protein